MLTGWKAVVALTMVVGLAGTAAAQQGRARGRVGVLRYQEMDRNHDGRISRDEWTGTPASFRVHDWNRDGVLSGDELRVDRYNPQPGDPEFDSAYRDYSYDDWTNRGFAALDHNRDNRITREEWHFDRSSFFRADHNRDGVISRSEFLSEDELDDDRGDTFGNLDANNDGRIARNEWHGAASLFSALDDNRDGWLSRVEMTGPEPATDLFTSVDINGDGAVTPPEWHWNRAAFDRRDVNKDGRLTQDEFRSSIPTNTQTSAYRAGYERGLIEGRSAGREDRVRNQGWDLEGQRELETADSGYDARFGSKAEYQTGYREAFRRAYREGWNNPS